MKDLDILLSRFVHRSRNSALGRHPLLQWNNDRLMTSVKVSVSVWRNSTTVESRYNVLPVGVGKKYVVTIVYGICIENFPSRGIETWEKVPYNGGYAVNEVRRNVT